VLELGDLVDRAVNLDVVAVFELVGGDQVESVLLEPMMVGGCFPRRERPDNAMGC
jgi:hypothetical protein